MTMRNDSGSRTMTSSSSSLTSPLNNDFAQATSTYHATPLEQAFAAYLLDQVLHLSLTPPVRISGRDAVFLLTASELPRVLLKQIWNVADPQNVGSLTCLTQWHTVLRLVALAQHDLIENLDTVTVQDLDQTLQRTLTYTHVPLPQFACLLQVPPPQVLLQQYAPYICTPLATSTTGGTAHGSVSDAFALLPTVVDAPLPTLPVVEPPVVKEEEEDDEFGEFEASPMVTSSHKTEAAPPVEEDVQESLVTADFQTTEMTDPTVTGDIKTATTVVDSTPIAASDTNQNGNPLSSAFALGPLKDTPLPVLGGTIDKTSIVEQQKEVLEEDSFGDFAQVTKGTNVDREVAKGVETEKIPQVDTSSSVAGDPRSFAFDALGPVRDAPLPALGETVSHETTNNVTAGEQEAMEDSFGEFAPVAAPEEANANVVPNEERNDVVSVPAGLSAPVDIPVAAQKDADSLSLAFDALGPVQDKPLPALGETLHHQVPPEVEEAEMFGEFATSQETTVETEGPDSAGVESNPLSVAFDSVAPLENQPLPPLGVTATAVEAAEEDGFGEFEGTAEEEQPPVVEDPLSSAFDSVAPLENQPLPPLGATGTAVEAIEEDGFGEFEGTAEEEQASGVEDPLSSAFDSVAALENQPLPPLGATATAVEGIEEDGFGEFEGTVEGEQPPVVEDPVSSAFDSVAPLVNQPLPPLGDTIAEPHAKEDGFGEFGGTQVSNEPPVADDPLSSAFDAISPLQDQPLPALGSDSLVVVEDQPLEAVAKENLHDDLFGGFSGAQGAAVDEQPSSDKEPVSSTFDLLSTQQNQPLPSLETNLVSENDENFGEFGEGVQKEDPDDFGDFDEALPPPPELEAEKPKEQTSHEGDGAGVEEDVNKQECPETKPSIKEPDKVNAGTISEDDPFAAFESLGSGSQVELPPLASFGSMPDEGGNSEVVQASNTISVEVKDANVGDEFGGFEDAVSPVPEVNMDQTQEKGKTAVGAEADGAFGDFDGAAPVPEAEMGIAREKRSLPEEDDAEVCAVIGGSETRTPVNTSYQQPGEEAPLGNPDANADDDPFAAFESLGAGSQVELPPLPSFGSMPSEGANGEVVRDREKEVEAENDEFGDFEAVDPVGEETPDAADALPVAPTTISMGVSEQQVETDNAIVDDSEAAAVTDDVNGFGGFGSVPEAGPQIAMTETLTPLPKITTGFAMQSSAHDDFDGFESVEPAPHQSAVAASTVLPETVAEGTKTEEHDDFGDFGGFESVQEPVPHQSAVEASTTLPGTDVEGTKTEEHDDFGGFESVEPAPYQSAVESSTVLPETVVEGTKTEEHDDFGDFDGFESVQEPVPHQSTVEESTTLPETGVEDTETEEHDDFGDFGGFESVAQPESQIAATEPATPTPETVDTPEHDDFGDFEGFDASPWEGLPTNQSGNSAKETGDGAVPPSSAEQAGPLDEDVSFSPDPFNLLSDTADAPTRSAVQSTTTKTDTSHPETSKAVTHKADDWGAFEDAPRTASAPVAEIPSKPEPSFGASFDTVEDTGSTSKKPQVSTGSANSSIESLEGIQAQIRQLGASLADSSLCAKSKNRGSVDFGAVFGSNVLKTAKSSSWRLGFKSPKQKSAEKMDPRKRNQAQRALEILQLLASNSNYAQVWERTLKTIRDELATGSLLLQDANELSRDELAQDELAIPLGVFLQGMAEYVRVMRSIVASIGDLLGLEPSTVLTSETLSSSWKSLALIHVALEVQDAWAGIIATARDLGLSYKNTLESIPDIRTQCLQLDHANTSLCRLTLQRLVADQDTTTRSLVLWDDKPFMACAANFWSNRVSPTVPC